MDTADSKFLENSGKHCLGYLVVGEHANLEATIKTIMINKVTGEMGITNGNLRFHNQLSPVFENAGQPSLEE